MRFLRPSTIAAGALFSTAAAITFTPTDPSSVKSAAKTLAGNIVSYYSGNTNGDPGVLPYPPYYWWEAGGMFGVLIDYWYYTGDTTYNNLTSEGLQSQVSPTFDYMPTNQQQDEGNDDQIFWAFTVMSAAEYNFPNPTDDLPQWLALAQGVFNSQAARWFNTTCNGGLHWQIFQINNGYNYKNSPSNAGFLNLGARLYAYTGNESYANWVTQTWDWMAGVGLISTEYNVYDGTSEDQNCTQIDHVQWTYSYGMLIHAGAVMWGKTQDPVWEQRVQGLWKMSTEIFFENQVMLESACEPEGTCDTDQLSFKAYFTRFLTAAAKIAPWFQPMIQPYILASSQAAAAQCTGGDSGISCGSKWTGAFDGMIGLGQEMTAIEIIMANLIEQSRQPVSSKTGGTSKGNATFGTGGDSQTVSVNPLSTITTADRAGAGILTALALVGTLGGAWWLVV